MQLPPERPAHAPRRRSLTADTYTDAELDALREVANIGSSTAATAMSSLIGVPVDVSTPSARAMQLTDAIERVGPAEMVVTTVVVPVTGDLEALVLMVLAPHTEEEACRLIGVERDSDLGRSALVELGNILAASYLGALSTLTGLSLEPSPPEGVRDMLRAVLSSVLIRDDGDGDVLILESTLSVAVAECSPTFLFVPSGGSVEEIIERLRVPA
jgi:chemotaxis protein CheC